MANKVALTDYPNSTYNRAIEQLNLTRTQNFVDIHTMTAKDIRWIQRAQNFEKAFLRLKEVMEMEKLNELERDGLIQRFEFTIDLAWKVMKNFLEHQGFDFKPSPRETYRMAQRSEFIDFAQELIDGLDIRNELSHDYSGEKFKNLERQLREETYPALGKLYQFYASQGGSHQTDDLDG
jgi:nucleotidyltransferase substrate binding protein (TIGR01987 family)